MKRIIAIVIALVTTGLMSLNFASTNYTGYSVYRDGVVGTVQWHAGVVVKENSSFTNPIVHIPGYDGNVQRASVDQFVAGKNFAGVYKNPNISSSGRANVAYMAERLIGYNIPYTAFQLVQASNGFTGKLEPSNITAIRCDGVVEYCNDYYGFNFQYSNITSTTGFYLMQGWSPVNQASNQTFLANNIRP